MFHRLFHDSLERYSLANVKAKTHSLERQYLCGGFTIVLKARLVMKVKVVLGINLALAANLVLKTTSVKNAIRFVSPLPRRRGQCAAARGGWRAVRGGECCRIRWVAVHAGNPIHDLGSAAPKHGCE